MTTRYEIRAYLNNASTIVITFDLLKSMTFVPDGGIRKNATFVRFAEVI